MSKVLVGLTGSIACFKVASLISELVKNGHEVKCLATPSALKFIGESTLEGLTGNPVSTDLFTSGENMDHIHCGRWADIFLVAPGTANTLAKLKVGLADDIVSATALAFEKDKPTYIAPAMNKEMWSNAATDESVKTLKDRGYHFIDPESGDLACGEVGTGRMAEVERIKEALFSKKTGRVLVTGGGTREPIDGVRFIGNSSTGRTSSKITEHLRRDGYEVDLLLAQESFTDYESLEKLLKNKLSQQRYDAVIHAAAVSDYSVHKICTDGYSGPPDASLKIKTGESIKIEMKANPKLLNSLRTWSLNPEIKIFGFKLTQTSSEQKRAQAVEKLFAESPANFVIHNDLTEMTPTEHPFRIMSRDHVLQNVNGASSLATELSKLIEGAL